MPSSKAKDASPTGRVPPASKDNANKPKGRNSVKPSPIAPKVKGSPKASPVTQKDNAKPKGRSSVKSSPVAPKVKGSAKASPGTQKGRGSAKANPRVQNGRGSVKTGRTGRKNNHGRVFLKAVKGLSNSTRKTSTYSKYNINRNLSVNLAHPEMNSELWNYLTSRAQSILNLTTEPVTTVPVTPTFRFLNLAKEILQKACPDSYVADEHFDMAYGAFSSLQTRIFNFKDAFTDYATGLRIEESLKFCRDNITTYPFVDVNNRTKETCNKTIVSRKIWISLFFISILKKLFVNYYHDFRKWGHSKHLAT